MNPRVYPGADDRENRHRFRRTVDARPPVLTEQKQDRRNQRTRVTNTDPEHEVHDRPRPEHRAHVTPDTNPLVNQEGDQGQKHHRRERREPKQDPPNPRLRILGHSANHLGHRGVGLIPGDQWCTTTRNVVRVVDFSRIVGTSYGGHGHLMNASGLRDCPLPPVSKDGADYGLRAALEYFGFARDTTFVA